MLMTYPAQQQEARAKEAMVLTFIQEFRADNKDDEGKPISPSVRDIGEELGWQPSTVHKVIMRLYNKGKVQKKFGKPRGIFLATS